MNHPRAAALIVIDMQRDFCSPGGYAAHAGLDVARLSSVIGNIARLIDAARAAGMPVIYTREGHLPDLSDCTPAKLHRSRAAGAPIGQQGPLGRLLVRGEIGHDIIDELAPEPGDIVIDKPGYGAFHRTDLEAVLQRLGVKSLLLCGVTLEVCVHSSLREAVDRGYRCITIGDACAAGDPALQEPALLMISVEGGIFGAVANTEDALRMMRAEQPA
ncbi:cysteine hydrolase family protein [Noviherbaspirillum pedocola]|uniref:Cysteine hydrolase n=1 Tax=Noviherbaspirillum pedocola TaxID=2801341 RepID=A0A934T2U5_9BURK|nr:isochorismatase family cysteine hydrolase [Noviherbaspirillum pedocola]MBK4737153.1 cysteine hydrolase [Noviherbaspirillum pedocola]